MAFALEPVTVVLDDVPFEAFKEVNSDKHYFAERIGIKGELRFGEVRKGQEAQIDLEANGITTPIMLTELFAFTPNRTSDEVWLYLYVKVDGALVKIGSQRVSAGQMPYDIPNGILRPDMVIGVEPTKSAATIIAYAKPVAVAFEAVPSQTRSEL